MVCSPMSHLEDALSWTRSLAMINAVVAPRLVNCDCEATPSPSAYLCVATGCGVTAFEVAYF